MDDCSLLLVEAGVIRGEDAGGLVIGTVLAVARTTGGAVRARPGDTELAPGDSTTTSACVCYLVDHRPESPDVRPGFELRTADPDGWLGARRPPEWEADEWDDLIAGRLGPWAMVRDESGVASICHSSRFTPAGAEAGVYTASSQRGCGLARSATAAWARQLWDRGVPAFYSHADDNVASRRVAEALGLRLLGRLWFVTRREPEP